MEDRELKRLLEQTCPVRPGQESRAWASLRAELYGAKEKGSALRFLYYPAWRGTFIASVAIVVAVFVGDFYFANIGERALATADSQSPGIYATAFYSTSADAQVVWLNGMEPASDRPTYLDPTTETSETTDGPSSVSDPNSL